MPHPRTQRLTGTELPAAFYDAKVQKVLEYFDHDLDSLLKATNRNDHNALLAWPLILFEIVNEATQPNCSKPAIRARFWEAFDEDPESAAQLLSILTEFNHSLPDVWRKERLLVEVLSSVRFRGETPEWATVREYIEELYSELPDWLPNYYPQNYSQHLSEINDKRREVLDKWDKRFKAKQAVDKAGIRIPPLLLRPAAP